MQSSVQALFETAAGDYADKDLLRERRPLQPGVAPRVVHAGRSYLNFCSNDYLGLATDWRLANVVTEAVAHYGVGAGASQYVTGYQTIHAELEHALAEFCGYERALIFSSGYMANLGAITALCDRNTSIHIDRLAHASLIDAVVLSRARFKRYSHNDHAALADNLGRDNSRKKLVISEGIFSMEGDRADLSTLVEICRSQGALLYLDDAHAFGIAGAEGRGSRNESAQTSDDVPVMMATFGKALGVSGAFVAGSNGLMETLVQQARSMIYTTAPPPAMAAAVLRALDIVRAEQWRRDKLETLIEYWRDQADKYGLPGTASTTAIQPLVLGDNNTALMASRALFERGFIVTAIRPPTVPAGSARLRITLTSAHDESDIDQLISALTEILSACR